MFIKGSSDISTGVLFLCATSLLPRLKLTSPRREHTVTNENAPCRAQRYADTTLTSSPAGGKRGYIESSTPSFLAQVKRSPRCTRASTR